MTFLAELQRELAARGIRGRWAARIEAELADHLACDPDAQLGRPSEIAERFAVELRGVRTRRASVGAFAALALTALLLVALVPPASGGSAARGLGILGFGQIALVAGTLAVRRALRGRGPGDLRLAQRRALVALAAGAGVCLSVGVQQPVGLAALVPLLAAAVLTRRAVVLTPDAPAEGLAADLGRHASLMLLALAVVAVAGVVFQGIAFEGSGWEGVIRGALEAGGLGVGVVVLGRPLGLRA